MNTFVKKHLKRNWIKIMVCAIFLFIVFPWVINKFYIYEEKLDCLQLEWNAGDFIQFYGSIVGGLLTIYGVYLTIRYTQINYEDDARNRILPFMAFNLLDQKTKRRWLDENTVEEISESEYGICEYDLDEVFFILDKGKIQAQDSLNKQQKRILINGGVISQEFNRGVTSVVDAGLIYQTIIIENVGVGPAIKVRIGFNEISSEKKGYCKPITLKTGDTIPIHLFSSGCEKDSENLGEYELSISYMDIYNNKYIQKMPIELGYEEELKSLYVSMQYDTKQIIVD